MRKKIVFLSVLTVLVMCALAISVSATTEISDDETDTLTLGECTIAGLDGLTIPAPTVGLVYTLDEEALTATVSGRGSFSGGELVFPSTVTYGGNTYAVTKINSNLFQKLTYDLYVPDSVTFMGGGANTGTFGNSTIGKIYIGSGLDGFERETFSGSKGYTSFVCKSKPTYIGVYAFNQNAMANSTLDEYELDLSRVIRFEDNAFAGATFLQELKLNKNVEYIGSSAFVGCSNMNGSVVIPADCTLSYRCFNGTSLDLVVIEINEGETKSMPQEMFSGASGDLTIVFNGNAVAGGDHFFSGNSGTAVYMPSYEHIDGFVQSVASKNGNGRVTSVTFYSCKEGKYYTATANGEIIEQGEYTAHIYGETASHFEADCSRGERDVYVCYSCGNEQIISEGEERGAHIFEVSTKAPNCQSIGYSEYTCTVCGLKESAHYIGKSEHSGIVNEYELKGSQTVTVTVRCEYCNEVVSVEDVSLVNKCYIEGYGLFDATLDYLSISADGVVTPSSANFDNAVIYFPSCAEVDGTVVEVKTIQGFKKKSIKSIYIPDTVTRIVGGSGTGCFGDISTLKNIVVGKGVSELEQEVFCMGSGASVDEFIFKGTITKLNYICMRNLNASSTDIPYEFDTALTYVGKQVNMGGNVLREAKLIKNCDLSEKFAFNNANGLKTVYIVGGDTPEEALDLGQEMMSNTATVNIYIKGYVTVSGQAVLSGQNNTRIYMSNTEAIDLFAAAIKSNGYADRINKATFMDCSTNTAWYISNTADRVVHSTVAYSHGGAVTVNASTCAQNGSTVVTCFVCDEVVSTTETEKLLHSFDGGVIVQMPTETDMGIITYTCINCGETKEEAIFNNYGNHKEKITVLYQNGFDKDGVAIFGCTECDYSSSNSLKPVFVVLGYSAREDGTGITCGYMINLEELTLCQNNIDGFDYGFLIVNASDASKNGLVNGDLKLLEANRGYQISLAGQKYAYLDVKVTGADTEEAKAFDFLLAVYVIADSDGDGKKDISYVQDTLDNVDNKPITGGLNTVSINRVIEDKIQ